MENTITGSCQCGQLTYQLFSPPKVVMACHCTECQKLSTSPFSVTALINANDIKFSGELKEWSRGADSGNTVNCKFCPHCGNRVYHYNPDDMATIKLKLQPQNLVNAELFKPSVHVWISEKLSWFKLPDDVKAFDKQP